MFADEGEDDDLSFNPKPRQKTASKGSVFSDEGDDSKPRQKAASKGSVFSDEPDEDDNLPMVQSSKPRPKAASKGSVFSDEADDEVTTKPKVEQKAASSGIFSDGEDADDAS